MTIKWVCNGKTENIPPVGARLKLPDGWEFEVESYGETGEFNHPTIHYNNKLGFEIELEGKLIIPAGTPIKDFERMLGFTNEKWKDLE